MNAPMNAPLLRRLAETGRDTVHFMLDGQPVSALAGDTVLTAVLTQHDRLRRNEFSGAPRAGFCMMGACQDCWIGTADGGWLRACTTFVDAGMSLVTGGSEA
jgi:predicted molibdopterin-dependent oxidoreductase YjgC